MFCKKVLSIMTLLFLGSQFASVSAEPCEPSYSAGLTIDANCNIGYYLINKAGNDGLSTNASTDCDGTDAGGENFKTCTLVYCSQNDGSTACAPEASFTGYSTYGLDGTTLLECTSGQCKVVSSVTPSKCSESVAGGLMSTSSKLCITNQDNSEVDFDYNVKGYSYYYITVADSTTTVFTGAQSGNKKILIKVGKGIATEVTSFGDTTTSYLAHDEANDIAVKYGGSTIDKNEALTGGKPIYCVNGETSAIEDRQSNFCSSSLPCSQYCTFASGVCTKIESDEQFVFEKRTACNPTGDSEEKQACANGYYILYDSVLVTIDTAGNTPTAITIVKCEDGVCGASTPIGFIANADSRTQATLPFVKCTSGGCSKLANEDKADNLASASTAGLLVNSASVSLVATSKEASLTSDGLYLLDARVESVFNDHRVPDHFVVIKIEYGSAILYRKADFIDDEAEYRYKYTDATLKLFERKATEVCNPGATINEYMLDKKDVTIAAYDDNEYYAANGDPKTWDL